MLFLQLVLGVYFMATWLVRKLSRKCTFRDLADRNCEEGHHSHFVMRDERTGARIMTEWNVIHLVWYFSMAVLFPRMWWLLLLTGVVWEGIETVTNMHDWHDLLYNVLGVSSGLLVSQVALPLVGLYRDRDRDRDAAAAAHDPA